MYDDDETNESGVGHRIHELESEGKTGATCPELDRLNKLQTGSLSDRTVLSQIASRSLAGKPVIKLIREAQNRNLMD